VGENSSAIVDERYLEIGLQLPIKDILYCAHLVLEANGNPLHILLLCGCHYIVINYWLMEKKQWEDISIQVGHFLADGHQDKIIALIGEKVLPCLFMFK